MRSDAISLDTGGGSFSSPTTYSDSRGALSFTETEPQQIGAEVSHTEFFKSVRDSTIDRCVVETNKLLIRLDKLIAEAPADPSERKGNCFFSRQLGFRFEHFDL